LTLQSISNSPYTISGFLVNSNGHNTDFELKIHSLVLCLNLTQNLGREWGAKGVRVNALRPGFLPTEWNRKNFITLEREAAILGHTPMARFGEPIELIGATLWLASDAASFVTGAEIAVDGGFSCMTI
jgi:NAD(P)-dependent dehydrogenase (short-subunit alcohol dehydrogenase family)